MKTKLLLAVSALVLSVNAYALPPKPAACPDAAAISQAGLDSNFVQQDQDGKWLIAMMSNEYNTPGVKWSFIVAKVDADNAEEAYAKATDSLTSLAFKQGPFPIQQISRWGCLYTNAPGYIAITVTPDLAGGMLQGVTRFVN